MKRLPRGYKQLDSIIRVDHAGEYGAKRIYLGQLAVLGNHVEIQHMYNQELVHLEYFEQQIRKRKVRPTVLQPLWHVGGFMLGAVTALIGEKAAMACTVAVEEVIGEHYTEQLRVLESIPNEEELSKKIDKFREEELEHKDHGLMHGAEETLGFAVIKAVITGITKMAIFCSKRI